jgi:hypothetical protein
MRTADHKLCSGVAAGHWARWATRRHFVDEDGTVILVFPRPIAVIRRDSL